MDSPKKNLLTVTGKEAFTHSTYHSIYDHNDTYLPDTASDDPIASRAKTSQGRKHLPQTSEGLLAPGVKAWAKKGVWEGPVCSVEHMPKSSPSNARGLLIP